MRKEREKAGLTVKVRNNDINGALRVLKKRMQTEGVLNEIRERKGFRSKGEKKRLAAVERDNKSREIYEKIRYQPVHGLEPMRPEMDPKPSAAGMILGLAGAAVGGFESAREFKAKDISNKNYQNMSTNTNWAYTPGSMDLTTAFNTDLGIL